MAKRKTSSDNSSGEPRSIAATPAAESRPAEEVNFKLPTTAYTVHAPGTRASDWYPTPPNSDVVEAFKAAVRESGVSEHAKGFRFSLTGEDMFFDMVTRGTRLRERFVQALKSAEPDGRGLLILELARPPSPLEAFLTEPPAPVTPMEFTVESPANRESAWTPTPPNEHVFQSLRDAVKEAANLSAGRTIRLLLLKEHLSWPSLKDVLQAFLEVAPPGGEVFIDLPGYPQSLTKLIAPRQSEGVREERGQKTSVFDELERLARPKPPPPEIQALARILEQAKSADPPDKERFVGAVNKALESHAFAIRIEPTGEVCRRLDLDRNGYLQLRTTRGTARGFKGTDFTLVPYVRPYRRSTPPKK